MRLTIDTGDNSLVVDDGLSRREIPLYSADAFAEIARQWLRVGWSVKYSYRFQWLGRPIIQLPSDMFAIQELVCDLRPAVIVETGVAHGGSLVFYASLCHALGTGRVIGVEAMLRPENRQALAAHPLAPYITVIEGSSTDQAVFERVRQSAGRDEPVLVILDSNHSRSHVKAELDLYHPLVTAGSYLLVADGIMEELSATPGGRSSWASDNPAEAVRDFLALHPEFVAERPRPGFDESEIGQDVTYFAHGWLRRVSA